MYRITFEPIHLVSFFILHPPSFLQINIRNMTSVEAGTEKQQGTIIPTGVDAANVEGGNDVEFTENCDDENYSGKDKFCSRLKSAFVGFLFPKVTPIKWTTFLLLTFLAIIP